MDNSEKAVVAIEDNLPANQAEKVAQISARIDFYDPSLTVAYGAKAMNDIAQFADGLLKQVKGKDSGPVGEILGTLLSSVQAIDVNQLGDDKGGILRRLPVIGSVFNTVEKQMRQLQSLADQVDAVTAKLDGAMIGLLRDIEVLEQLYGLNKDHYSELSLYIAAGKQKLELARNTELPRLKEKAEASGDSMDAQMVRDFAERLNRFEKRLHDLQISRTVALQTVPQIRMIQNNDQTLAEKIQTSILTTIPLWKNQMVLAMSLVRQKKALKMQKDVSDATNALLMQNAQMLEDSTIGTAREVERSVVDFETIKAVHDKLLGTIEETLRIAEEGRARRAGVEEELGSMENSLRQSLMELSSQKGRAAINAQSQTALEAARAQDAPVADEKPEV